MREDQVERHAVEDARKFGEDRNARRAFHKWFNLIAAIERFHDQKPNDYTDQKADDDANEGADRGNEFFNTVVKWPSKTTVASVIG